MDNLHRSGLDTTLQCVNLNPVTSDRQSSGSSFLISADGNTEGRRVFLFSLERDRFYGKNLLSLNVNAKCSKLGGRESREESVEESEFKSKAMGYGFCGCRECKYSDAKTKTHCKHQRLRRTCSSNVCSKARILLSNLPTLQLPTVRFGLDHHEQKKWCDAIENTSLEQFFHVKQVRKMLVRIENPCSANSFDILRANATFEEYVLLFFLWGRKFLFKLSIPNYTKKCLIESIRVKVI